MKDDEVEYEKLEHDVEDEADPSKYFGIILSLYQLKRQEHEENQLNLLKPQIKIKVFSVALAHTVP